MKRMIRYNDPKMSKLLTTKGIALLLFFFLAPLRMALLWAQSGEQTVKRLVEMGFENVGWTEDAEERVYVLQNSAYRLQGVGIGKAVDVIQKEGLPESKKCRIVVLNNNIPEISLSYSPIVGDSVPQAERRDWNVSYEVDDAWKKLRGVTKSNSSLFKVDVVVYPWLMFQNYKLSKMYDYVFQLSPAIEVSMWKGMKLTGQVVFPIVNDYYGRRYGQVRPGFLTISQSVRLPYNIFLQGIAGLYEGGRSGFELRAKYVFPDEHFWLTGRLGYTRKGYWDHWSYYHGVKWTMDAHLGVHYYWPQFNTEFKLKGERFLMEECGFQFEMYRHFRHASIGFYAMKIFGKDDAANNGVNGGFAFRIALPPYKYKRKGYMPRLVAGEFGFRYNSGNEKQYGNFYRSSPDDNFLVENAYNPYFIKSELLNF